MNARPELIPNGNEPKKDKSGNKVGLQMMLN